MYCNGYTQQKRADKLNVHQSLVSLDLQYMKEYFKSAISEHLNETIPTVYNMCMTGLRNMLMETSELKEQTDDPKLKMGLIQLSGNIYRELILLSNNEPTVRMSIEFSKKEIDKLRSQIIELKKLVNQQESNTIGKDLDINIEESTKEEERLLLQQRETIRIQEQQSGDREAKGTNDSDIELEEVDSDNDNDSYDTEYELES